MSYPPSLPRAQSTINCLCRNLHRVSSHLYILHFTLSFPAARPPAHPPDRHGSDVDVVQQNSNNLFLYRKRKQVRGGEQGRFLLHVINTQARSKTVEDYIMTHVQKGHAPYTRADTPTHTHTHTVDTHTHRRWQQKTHTFTHTVTLTRPPTKPACSLRTLVTIHPARAVSTCLVQSRAKRSQEVE